MIHTTLALLVLTLARTGTARDGEGWLKQAEQKLYRWPRPGVVVSFEAETDALGPTIAAMRNELRKNPDPEGARFVDALEKMKIRGSIDTASGKVTSDIEVAYKCPDARCENVLGEIEKRVGMTINGCFQGLPLSDPSFFKAGTTVTGCEEEDDFVEVALVGAKNGEEMKLRLSRPMLLPEAIETPAFTGRYQFEESIPRRFLPSRLELAPRSGAQTSAEYTYQKVGDLLFPAHVKVTQRDQVASITFSSLSIGRRTP